MIEHSLKSKDQYKRNRKSKVEPGRRKICKRIFQVMKKILEGGARKQNQLPGRQNVLEIAKEQSFVFFPMV